MCMETEGDLLIVVSLALCCLSHTHGMRALLIYAICICGKAYHHARLAPLQAQGCA